MLACWLSVPAATSPKPIDLVQMPAIASSASSIFSALAAEAGRVEADFEAEAAGMCDVYGNGAWIEEFQSQVAADLGKEAAVFMPTGVCAQMAALAVHAGLPLPSRAGLLRPSFLTHPTSHLLLWEENAYSDLLGLTAIKAGTRSRPLLAADVEVELKRLSSVGLAPCCMLIELPWRELGCHATPWDELLKMRALADRYGVPLHMDGARLLEIAPFYGRPPAEVAALFDSVYISFYKGLGGLSGAMLLGDAAFVTAAKPWRRRLGGTAYTALPTALSCRVGYERNRHSFAERWQWLARLAPQLAAASKGRVRFEPPEPQCCHAHCYLTGRAEDLAAARDAALAATGVRVFRRLRAEGVGDEARECYFEWVVGPQQLALSEELVLRAWTAFLEAL